MGLRHQLGVHLLGEVMPRALELDRRVGHGIRSQCADEWLGQEVLDGDELARVDHAAARVGVHAIGPGPAEQDLLEQDVAAGAVLLLYVGTHQVLQTCIPSHRLPQVVDISGASHLRQCSYVGTHRNGGFSNADGGVSRQQVLADGPARAVAARERARALLGIPQPVAGAGGGESKVDRFDAQSVQGEQLAAVAEAVGVHVAPHAQVRPDRVAGVDHAVAVAAVGDQIPFGQRLHTVGRHSAAAQYSMVAEQLTAIVDAAVPVAIECQEPVVPADPPGQLGEPIGVVVEVGDCLLAERLDAVAVQVEHERVAARRGHRLSQHEGGLVRRVERRAALAQQHPQHRLAAAQAIAGLVFLRCAVVTAAPRAAVLGTRQHRHALAIGPEIDRAVVVLPVDHTHRRS